MQSKKFCFNKAIFMGNIKKYWPIWGSYLLVLFISMPLTIFRITEGSSNLYPDDMNKASQIINHIDALSDTMVYLVIVATAITAILVNSYLYQVKSVSFFHALPLRRESLFLTNAVSGYLIIFVPNLICTAISMIIAAKTSSDAVVSILLYFVVLTVQSLFYYSFATLCAMVTGQFAAACIFFVVMINYVSIMADPVCSIIEDFVFGITNDFSRKLYDLSVSSLLEKTHHTEYIDGNISFVIDVVPCIVFILVSALIFALALILYKRRNLETASDAISFKFLRPIFRWGVGISAMFCGGVILPLFFGDSITSTVVFAVISGFVGFIGAEMIMKKTFRVFKKCYKELIAFIVVILAFFAVLKFDVFGIENKVPEASEVESVYLDCAHISTGCTFDDEESIKEILELHQSIIDNKDEYKYGNTEGEEVYVTNVVGISAAVEEDSYPDANETADVRDYFSTYVSFTYSLKNGGSIRRVYYITYRADELLDSSSFGSRIRQFVNSKTRAGKFLFPEDFDVDRILTCYVDLVNDNYDMKPLDLDKSQARELCEAYMKDIEEGNYDLLAEEDKYISSISIGFESDKFSDTDENGNIYPYYFAIPLHDSFVNTISYIEKNFYTDDGFKLRTN